MTENNYPNCSLCEWKIHMFDPLNKIDYVICLAQGNAKATDVYGNKHCKKVYNKEIDNE